MFGLIQLRTFQDSKRATLYVALFFSSLVFLAPYFAWANRSESYRDVIEKAFSLSLQRDRAQALQILISAYKKEHKKPFALKEISQAIEKISTLFLSDKAQQAYELGLSLVSTDPAMAYQRLQDAQRIETDNLLVEIALGRLNLAQNDCAQATGRNSKLETYSLHVELVRIYIAQTHLCSGKYDLVTLPKLSDRTKSVVWSSIELELLFKQGHYIKGRERSLILMRLDSQYPEVSYWVYRIEEALKMPASRAAERYVNLCKALSLRQQRTYLADPYLCRRMTEAEAYLKKAGPRGGS
ncbi:MAG: hypothetical protein LW875_07865 [Proteobacteria bacterium]|jgi:hypothetical protein|nr:hypothetical protein [Pseudomonadota bacterium]